MDLENSIFNKYKYDEDKLIEYGFIKNNNMYKYNRVFFNNRFRMELYIDGNNIKGIVYDNEFDEEYNNIRVKDINGEFVNSVKYEYINILKDIRDKCFINNYFVNEQSNRIVKYIKDKYNVIPEFLWDDDVNAALRHNNSKKWFGIIMNVSRNKIDNSDNKDMVDVINIKLDNKEIESLLNEKGYYPAYHMNKKSWISIILDNSLDDKIIMEYIDKSYNNTKDIRSWIIPANPKIFDVEKYILNKKIIDWPIKRSILVDDIVYIYYAKPFGGLLFKGKIISIGKEYMKIEIIKRFKKDEYPLNVLKEYGLNSVRCSRRINDKLYNYLEMC